jgi:hypothetical protein
MKTKAGLHLLAVLSLFATACGSGGGGEGGGTNAGSASGSASSSLSCQPGFGIDAAGGIPLSVAALRSAFSTLEFKEGQFFGHSGVSSSDGTGEFAYLFNTTVNPSDGISDASTTTTVACGDHGGESMNGNYESHYPMLITMTPSSDSIRATMNLRIRIQDTAAAQPQVNITDSLTYRPSQSTLSVLLAADPHDRGVGQNKLWLMPDGTVELRVVYTLSDRNGTISFSTRMVYTTNTRRFAEPAVNEAFLTRERLDVLRGLFDHTYGETDLRRVLNRFTALENPQARFSVFNRAITFITRTHGSYNANFNRRFAVTIMQQGSAATMDALETNYQRALEEHGYRRDQALSVLLQDMNIDFDVSSGALASTLTE